MLACTGLSVAAPTSTQSLAVAQCSSNMDCSLNGVCTNGDCVCDPGWITHADIPLSTKCGLLDFLPAPSDTSFHGLDVNKSSWGGSVLNLAPPTSDPKWFMFSAEMTHDCKWAFTCAFTIRALSLPSVGCECTHTTRSTRCWYRPATCMQTCTEPTGLAASLFAWNMRAVLNKPIPTVNQNRTRRFQNSSVVPHPPPPVYRSFMRVHTYTSHARMQAPSDTGPPTPRW